MSPILKINKGKLKIAEIVMLIKKSEIFISRNELYIFFFNFFKNVQLYT